jgi:hypothetical protein
MAYLNMRSHSFREEIGSLRIREDRVDLKDIPHYWSPNRTLPDLKNQSNQLIIGRRGIGKTTLLKKLCLDLQEELADRRVLGIYVDCNAIRITAESQIREQANEETLARELFYQCAIIITSEIRQFAAHIAMSVEAHPVSRFVERVLRTREKEIAAQLDDIAGQLQDGWVLDATEQIERAIEKEATSETGQDIGATIDSSVGSKLSAKMFDRTAEKRKTREKAQLLRLADPKPLLASLQRVIALAQLRGICIVLDDVTRISQFAHIQPMFFQYLKDLIPSGNDTVCLKFGAVAQELQTSSGALGLSQVDDLHTIDLDARGMMIRQQSPAEMEEYMHSILFRHLLFRVPNFKLAVTGSAETSGVVPTPSNWGLLFADPARCLRELVISACTNPRDLLAGFIYTCDHFINRSTRSLIDVIDVWEGIKHHYVQNKTDPIRKSQYLMDVEQAIADQFVRRTKHPSRVMCIKESEFARLEVDDAMREFSRCRILNSLGTWRGPAAQYRTYEIDIGVAINALIRSFPMDKQEIDRSIRSYEEFAKHARTGVDPKILAAQTLELPPARATIDPYARQMILCMAEQCGNRFPPSHPVYKKFDVCPQCGETIPAIGAARARS